MSEKCLTPKNRESVRRVKAVSFISDGGFISLCVFSVCERNADFYFVSMCVCVCF